MARFQNLPPKLFDDIHKHCDPESRLNLLQVSHKFYDLFIQSHLKHVRLKGSQGRVSASLARLLDADDKGHTKKNLRCIQTASIKLEDLFLWEFYEEGKQMEYVDDALLPHIVSLTTQATGLKFLRLEVYALTVAQGKDFRQLLKQPGKWTIYTLAIRSATETMLACLKKCDPMQLSGVDFVADDYEETSPASPFNIAEVTYVWGRKYNALKAFYNMRDDSKNQSPLLKRLRVRYPSEFIYPRASDLIKNTFDKVANITEDFPNLEWLIILEDLLGTQIHVERNLQAWEDLIEQFITKLEGTKLVKLAFSLDWRVMESVIKASSSNITWEASDTRIHECYLRLARRLVESVEGLKDVVIMCRIGPRYRATQS